MRDVGNNGQLCLTNCAILCPLQPIRLFGGEGLCWMDHERSGAIPLEMKTDNAIVGSLK